MPTDKPAMSESVPELLTVNLFTNNRTATIVTVGLDRDDANIVSCSSAAGGMHAEMVQAIIGPKLAAMLKQLTTLQQALDAKTRECEELRSRIAEDYQCPICGEDDQTMMPCDCQLKELANASNRQADADEARGSGT